MEIGYFLKGLALGLAIAAPVGPIALLCIGRTLTQGQGIGLATGLGAATADGLYGSIAAFGLVTLAQPFIHQALWLKMGGGLALCCLGIATLRSKSVARKNSGPRPGWWVAYGSTFLLTLSNPATMVSFIAIFASLGLGNPNQAWSSALAMVMGVWGGSALWWLCLTWGVTLFSSYLTPTRLIWLNRGAGVVLLVFGVTAVVLP
ncbi:MAG: LysE family translocator [Nodosilinea sp.]